MAKKPGKYMLNAEQLSFNEYLGVSACPIKNPILHAIERLAHTSDHEARGAIYTRIEVVEFILDLVGYKPEYNLIDTRILEPAFGEGDFLLPVIDRLLVSWKRDKDHKQSAIERLGNSVCAVELHNESYHTAKRIIIDKLINSGISKNESIKLSELWLIQGDFLLEPQVEKFDYIVGNPPYLRQESIPDVLLNEYRLRYKTMFDRADIYIPFIEKSLSLLKPNGDLGFICSDRWMKNRYGGPLRKFISKKYNLKAYIDMVETDAFQTDVLAYPAITVIGKGKQGMTRIAHRPKVDKEVLKLLYEDLASKKLTSATKVKEMAKIVNGSEPWLLESTDQLALLRKIECNFPTIEEVGCKVGIGVATGADRVYIQDYDKLDIEEDRKVKLVTTQDIKSGEVVWAGKGVINTFNDGGGTVDLNFYPKLSEFLESNSTVIRNRYIAKKNPHNWFRTIDRVWPELIGKHKLLIPDIKGEAHIVYESGQYYPHHNLYYVTSEEWNLRALQAVLLSNITKLFVGTYSTKMKGGYLRFQAQYLRRIRIPRWEEVSGDLRLELITAAEERNIEKCNKAVFKLYKLNEEEKSALGGNFSFRGVQT